MDKVHSTTSSGVSEYLPLLFVVPPLTMIVMPELGVSLLKARLNGEIKSQVLYSNILFANRVGSYLHEICSSTIGDSLFAAQLFSQDHRFEDGVLEENVRKSIGSISQLLPAEKLSSLLLAETQKFELDLVSRVTHLRPKVIALAGRYTVHNLSLLWLAHVFKRALPEVVVIAGGTAFYDEMGSTLFELFPDLDYVVQGEADESFPSLVQDILKNGALTQPIPGVLARNKSIPYSKPVLPTKPFIEPDLSDYFIQLKDSWIRNFVVPALVMEMSRGCWWGCKHPCVFCGMWGAITTDTFGTPFRDKGEDDLIAEVHDLVGKYGARHVFTTDALLSFRLYRMFSRLPDIPELSFHFEIKSNIKRDTLIAMRKHGVRSLGPGIESFSDQALKAMNKGVSAAQNIQTIKWATELGFNIHYFILAPIIGDTSEDVDKMATLIARMHHLSPPRAFGEIAIARFSTYHAKKSEYGLEPLKPCDWMFTHYPFSSDDLMKISYHFQSDAYDKLQHADEYARLGTAINAWMNLFYRSFLVGIPLRSSMLVFDSRRCRHQLVSRLTNLAKEIILLCDESKSLETILATLASCGTSQEISETLRDLEKRNIIVLVSNKYLALVNLVQDGFKKILSPEQMSFAGMSRAGFRERLHSGPLRGMFFAHPTILFMILCFEITIFVQYIGLGYKKAVASLIIGTVRLVDKAVRWTFGRSTRRACS